MTFATGGTKTLTATYGGDSNFNSITSGGVSHTVTDFSVSVSPTSQTIKAGQKTNFSLTLTPLSGFTGTVALSCAVDPSFSCTISPSSVKLTGSGSVTSKVTIQAGKTLLPGTYVGAVYGIYGAGLPGNFLLRRGAWISLTIK